MRTLTDLIQGRRQDDPPAGAGYLEGSPPAAAANSRRQERIAVAIPVVFDGGSGTTRDVSASGVFVETETILPLGARIDLLLDFREQCRTEHWVKCEADVLRIDNRPSHRGLAATVRWHVQ